MTQNLSESSFTFSAVPSQKTKQLKPGKVDVEVLLMTLPESRKMYPPNNNLV